MAGAALKRLMAEYKREQKYFLYAYIVFLPTEVSVTQTCPGKWQNSEKVTA